MLFRNREVRLETVVSLCLVLASASLGLLIWGPPGLLMGAVCLALSAVHLFFTLRRYGRIRRLGLDLDALLHNGTSLEIQDYAEGELEVLTSQLQKMTLRLTEAAETLQAEKLRLADSMADISHQLRTPLTAMNLTVPLLAAPDVTGERRQELTRELRRLLSRTDWLVDSLLKLSKLDAGTVELTKEQISVSQLVRRAAAPLAIPMELREQRLLVDVGDDAFTGDLVWTAEALGNILKNCMEHTPAGGTVIIRAQSTALYTQITVEDTGPGIDPRDLPHLFERFYKGAGASEDSFGIGLALARTIVTSQNGTLRAANTPTGAQFILKFYHQVI